MDNETKTEEKKKIVKINTGGWRGVLESTNPHASLTKEMFTDLTFSTVFHFD